MSVERILQTRESTHGSFAKNAKLSQGIKRKINESASSVLSDSMQESLDMISLKISRICTGSSTEKDHWDDIAGYATLVANELAGEAEEAPAPASPPEKTHPRSISHYVIRYFPDLDSTDSVPVAVMVVGPDSPDFRYQVFENWWLNDLIQEGQQGCVLALDRYQVFYEKIDNCWGFKASELVTEQDLCYDGKQFRLTDEMEFYTADPDHAMEVGLDLHKPLPEPDPCEEGKRQFDSYWVQYSAADDIKRIIGFVVVGAKREDFRFQKSENWVDVDGNQDWVDPEKYKSQRDCLEVFRQIDGLDILLAKAMSERQNADHVYWFFRLINRESHAAASADEVIESL